jgi:hypothetical protein
LIVKRRPDHRPDTRFLEKAEQCRVHRGQLHPQRPSAVQREGLHDPEESGQQERADRFLYNKPETVLTMTLKGPELDAGRDRRLQRRSIGA